MEAPTGNKLGHGPLEPRSQYADNRGVPVHYLDWGGSGPCLLLIHGMRGRARLWESVAPALAQHFHVVAMDVRGHGWSGRPADAPYDRRALASDAVAVLNAMGADKARVIGHSLGGWIAIGLAAHFADRVECLIVEDVGLDGDPDAPATYEKRARSTPASFSSREEGLEWLRAGGANPLWAGASLEQQPGGAWSWAYDHEALIRIARETAAVPCWDLAPRVTQPVLLFWGTRSWIHTAESVDRMAGAFPNCRGVVPFETNHWIHNEAPEAYLRAALPFLLAA
ncbi:MAG: alpha/beta fold hydrolase [Bacillota bacterium]